MAIEVMLRSTLIRSEEAAHPKAYGGGWRYYFNSSCTIFFPCRFWSDKDIILISLINRKLIMQWHPDKYPDDNEKCNEMTKKLTTAYKTILHWKTQSLFPNTQPHAFVEPSAMR